MTAPARPPPPPPPPPGIRGCHARGVPRSGVGVGARWGWGGTARWEASAAPCAADFDRLRRTAPAPEGALRLRRSRLVAAGHADHRAPPPPTTAPRVTARGAGGRVRAYCSLAFPLAVYVFSWEPSVWSGACIAGGGGGTSAPGAVTSTGRRPGASEAGPPGPASPPSCGARSETFVRSPLDQFFFFFAELWGFPASSHPSPVASSKAGMRGWGRTWRPGAGGPSAPPARPPPPRPGPPRPPAPHLLARGLLGNCDLNGC